jgi:hypothetical protein
VVSGCSTRLFVLGSRRRSFAVHPKFEVSSKNAQSCPALIKASQLAWFVRVSGTYDRNRILPILFEFRQTIFIEFVFEKVRSIRFPSNGLLKSTPSSKDEALPNAVVPRNLAARIDYRVLPSRLFVGLDHARLSPARLLSRTCRVFTGLLTEPPPNRLSHHDLRAVWPCRPQWKPGCRV